VNTALTAARGPEVQWQAQETTLQSQATDITTVNTQTTTVENDLNNLDSSFLGLTTSSTNSSVASATASAAAVAGNHVVVVNNLATASSWYTSTAVANSSTGLSAGTFSLQLGSGAASPITVTNGETLTQLASAINTLSLGATANVVTDASGSRLSIVSNSSGSANNIAITTPAQITAATNGSAWNSASVSDSTGFSGADSFSVQVGSGAATQIAVTSGESLTSLASAINGQSLGVTASVVSDGSGSSHLAIVNSATGTASGMTVTNQFTQAMQGANASLTVDGVKISSATNTVTGVVAGMTFNLNSSSPGTSVTISVASNTSGITTAINQFVTDYNTLIGTVNNEYTYSASSTASPLSGDSTLGLLQNALLGSASYSDTTNGAFSTLNALGITMNNDGTLTVDSSTLSDAVQNNSAAVQQLFEGTALNGFSASLNNQLQSLTAPTTGAFAVDLSSMQTSYNDLAADVSNFENNYIANLKTQLTAQYDAAEIALQDVQTTKQQINAELGNSTSSS
jgi:flagellar hook-associated protein 2